MEKALLPPPLRKANAFAFGKAENAVSLYGNELSNTEAGALRGPFAEAFQMGGGTHLEQSYSNKTR